MDAFILLLILNGRISIGDGYYKDAEECLTAGLDWKDEQDKHRGRRSGFLCEPALVVIVDGRLTF